MNIANSLHIGTTESFLKLYNLLKNKSLRKIWEKFLFNSYFHNNEKYWFLIFPVAGKGR